MAPPVEYLDGPSLVMPRPERDLVATSDANAEGTALTVGWHDPSAAARIRELVGSLWYGRATPA